MTDKFISNNRKVGGDFFFLQALKKSKHKLNYFLEKFNPDDYFIYKSTAKQKKVSIEDFLEFKYCVYILFKKGVYDNDNINIWIDWSNNIGGINYLVKPTPPFSPEKIIIKK
jgi:hypothetical protein